MGNSASYVPPQKESVIYPKFEAEQGSLAGKAYAVTGCTTGTGLVVAKLFAKKGAARVFLLNRPSPRAEAALAACEAVATEGCVATSA
jgi:NAD(P)-dependent dehydrogenase (short-subunit alcohol dehydrogenase family)